MNLRKTSKHLPKCVTLGISNLYFDLQILKNDIKNDRRY